VPSYAQEAPQESIPPPPLAWHPTQLYWFEEPVSSDDLDGLRLVRERAPAGMEIAAGEYGYDIF
jgi:L-alanine-DL-glutamate epimerase-like enolase superfamily enzyme